MYVCSLMPSLRTISATGVPASPCRSAIAICSSVNLDLLIGLLPPLGGARVARMYSRLLEPTRIRKRGSEHDWNAAATEAKVVATMREGESRSAAVGRGRVGVRPTARLRYFDQMRARRWSPGSANR